MNLRLKSELYVQALVRRVQADMCAAYVLARGDKDAGGIFVRVNRLDGSLSCLFLQEGNFLQMQQFQRLRLSNLKDQRVPKKFLAFLQTHLYQEQHCVHLSNAFRFSQIFLMHFLKVNPSLLFLSDSDDI